MNELAIIFDRMGIRTADVLAAAGTKWNFLKFRPGLVGGHCIGVDPYYLTMKAQQLGYQPEVILAGRRINNNVGAVRRPAAGEAPHRRGRHREERPRRRPRAHLQGGLQRPPQQQGPGHPPRAAAASASRPMRPRPGRQAPPRPSASTASSSPPSRSSCSLDALVLAVSATSGTSDSGQPRILVDDPRRRRPGRRQERRSIPRALERGIRYWSLCGDRHWSLT